VAKQTSAAVSKSDVIRDILKQQPTATVKEIQAALKERGVKASNALVNKIKYGRRSSGTHGRKSNGRRHDNSNGSKAEAIRKMWRQLGAHARNRDVIASLSSNGVTVSSAQVSMLRKTVSRRRGQGPAARVESISLDQLLAAKKVAEQLGGIEVARQALASFAKLTG
jgi:hypothetical protein